jgi:hypothetical protein
LKLYVIQTKMIWRKSNNNKTDTFKSIWKAENWTVLLKFFSIVLNSEIG